MVGLDEALREILRAQALDSLSLRIAAFCGSVCDTMRKRGFAEKQLKKVLETDPNFATAHSALYSVCFYEGKYGEAEREFEGWWRLVGKPPATRAWLAVLRALRVKSSRPLRRACSAIPGRVTG